jgi:hypothetical protein
LAASRVRNSSSPSLVSSFTLAVSCKFQNAPKPLYLLGPKRNS